MNWGVLFDFRYAALLQLVGFCLEFAAYKVRGREAYPWREAWRSLLIAIPAFVIWGIEIQLLAMAAQALEPHRFYSFDSHHPFVIGSAFLLAELHFYVTHRLQHQVSWMWADHQVHHSTTALNVFDGNRLGWTILLAGGFNTLFLPLVLLGISGELLIGMSSTILFFQFFIHTKAIPRLGPLDSLLNTPSNHRVHHASNLEYLDCNYGGMTVIFDRLFGTFVRERPGLPARFGLWDSDASRQSLVSLLTQGWTSIFRSVKKERSAKGVYMSLFGPPGWSSDGSTLTTDQLRELHSVNGDAPVSDKPPMGNEKKNQLHALTGREDLGRQLVLKQEGRLLKGARRDLIDYATTNYLGWDFHPRFLAQGTKRHEEWGSLSGWSRLEIDTPLYIDIEARLARLIGAKETILSHTITVTNFSIIPAIARKGSIFCDQKVHTVVWEACRLARDHGASLEKFRHQDMKHLDELLAKAPNDRPKLICVDGVYSISSECAPILELQALCRKHGAWLLVDDAHGFGVLGAGPSAEFPYGIGGGGVVKYAGGDYSRTFYVASMGKAFCTHTAFVTIPDEYDHSLREECMQYIYSAPLPPFVMGMVEASLDLNESEGDAARARVHALTRRFVEGLRARGLKAQNHDYFPIVFWEIGELPDLIDISEKLFRAGVVAGLRAFPVVPPNECGLRFGITALHTEAQIDKTLEIIASIAPRVLRDTG